MRINGALLNVLRTDATDVNVSSHLANGTIVE
jgi:hypothetical protein